MTNRINSLVIVLEDDLRDDDPRLVTLCKAIKLMRGVSHVDTRISDIGDTVAQARVRQELGQKLIEIVYPPKEPR